MSAFATDVIRQQNKQTDHSAPAEGSELVGRGARSVGKWVVGGMAGYAWWHRCITSGLFVPLLGAKGMMVSLRLKDDLVAEIERVAHAHGQSRSAWIANVLAREALAPENDALPVSSMHKRGRPDDQVRVTVRLNRSEIEAIDAVGAPMGLTRTEWIKRALRWQLWGRAAVLRLAPVTNAELGKLRKQVIVIGRNINQATHAMNAANQPGSSLDLARIAGPFIETCGELKTLLFAMRRSLTSTVGAEVSYWTGAAESAEK